MFTVTCNNCGKSAVFQNGKNDESEIEINGQVEALYDADVYLECKHCGNEVTIEKE